MSSISQDIQHLSPYIQVLFNIAATTTFVIWDTFLTFGEEVELIWLSRLSFSKVLYFTIRCLSLILHSGLTFIFFGYFKGADLCSEIMWFICVIGLTEVACSNILLIQRVYAFYGLSKPILWFLSSIFILNEATVVGVMALSGPRYPTIKDELPAPLPRVFGACIIEQNTPLIANVCFVELLFHSAAFVCIVARFAKMQFAARQTGVPYSQLHNIFFRDGVWTFFVLFLSLLFSGIYMHAQAAPGLSLILWTFSASSIGSTRLILNLHCSAKKSRSSCIPS